MSVVLVCIRCRQQEILQEGAAGEARLKELLPETSIYVKTIHDVEWFKSCDSEIISQNSASFREFVSALANLKCRWLAQKILPLN